MALTRHSVRTCFLWKDRADKLGPAGPFWDPFINCLTSLQNPADWDENSADSSTIEKAVRSFLEFLLEEMEDRSLAAELRTKLDRRPADEALNLFGRAERVAAEYGDPGRGGAVCFFLGQLMFLFGRLSLARRYTLESVRLLVAAGREVGPSKPSWLRSLEFLVATLLLEISFHSQGYDAVRSGDMPQGREVQAILIEGPAGFLEGLAPAPDTVPGLGPGATRESPMREYVRHFWLPIPTETDLEELTIQTDQEQLSSLPLSYVLSRENRAGMLRFRYREWQQAEEIFGRVVATIDQQEHDGVLDPVLVPLKYEALLYQGRLEVRTCRFDEARRHIEEAEEYFSRVRDEFAKNKARKAMAELEYRQRHWPEAERLFRQVRQESSDKGFHHDRAAAEMYLGKILSRFGFQSDASTLFQQANTHFRRYDVLRETVECLFWHIAAEARRLDLEGHPQESVVNAWALMKVYRRLFEASPGEDPEDDSLRDGGLRRLRELILDQRDPTVTTAMLHLRLGALPPPELVQAMEGIVASAATQPPQHKATQYRLTRQLLRLVHLQAHGRPKPYAGQEEGGGAESEAVRDRVLTALERAAASEADLLAACADLQSAYQTVETLRLGGGLVPALVDLSQFYVDRACFIGSLLVLMEGLDRVIRAAMQPDAPDGGLDVVTLKKIYCNLTKYLVLERNFYLGPPAFRVPSQASPELWRALEDRRRSQGWNWEHLHQQLLLGAHGISFPSNAVAFGWVQSAGRGSAYLHVLWLVDCIGKKRLDPGSFERLEVPVEVIEQGHARENDVVVLVGRSGEVEGETKRPWTAHRIPLELPVEKLFRRLRHSPWYEPDMSAWHQLLRRFIGELPVTSTLPEVGAEEVEARYQAAAREWFGHRFPPAVFERVFGFPVKEAPKPIPVRFSRPVRKVASTPAAGTSHPEKAEDFARKEAEDLEISEALRSLFNPTEEPELVGAGR